jgi:hypothetical protein
MNEKPASPAHSSRERDFHILSIGWAPAVIDRLLDPIASATGFKFSHVVDPLLDRHSMGGRAESRRIFVRDDQAMPMPVADHEKLAALEGPGIPTIHNMIMCDPIVRELEYSEALAYATYLTDRFESLIRELKPSMVLGGFDALHGGIGLAVARRMGVPWFALHFTTIPRGRAGFCERMAPDASVSYLPQSQEELRGLAQRTLSEFETKRLVVPAYLSANTFGAIAKRFPSHFRTLARTLQRVFSGRFDRFTQVPVTRMAKEYIRKRANVVRLPKKWFVETPPSGPFLFFGFQRQPESSVDVWAPFFADQFAVVEAIARSTPPTHQVLIKIHKSDADNYSPRELARLRRLPGVRLVSPYAASRDFIDQAALVIAIQGNMGLEAALLGKPVLVFGDSGFVKMPSVSKVQRITDLPSQIRSKLSEKPPASEEIVRGFMAYLGGYAPGCYNDWTATPTKAEIEALANHFRALRDAVEANAELRGVTGNGESCVE